MEQHDDHPDGGRGEIRRLEEQPDQDILIGGSAELVHSLLADDLIDEYPLVVHSVVVGKGKRLFADEGTLKTMQLVDTRTFPTGVTVLTYHLAPKDAVPKTPS